MEAKQFRKRNAILTCLRQTTLHPSAEMLYAMLREEHPDISLATVYRNLALFRSQGLIQSLGTVQGAERFDGNPQPHVHFVCSGCGAVLDLPEMEPPLLLCRQAEACAGCRVESCQLIFSGRCAHCLERDVYPPAAAPEQ